MSATADFRLPGAWFAPDGTRHRDGQLRPLSGRDEEWMHAISPAARQAHLVTEILARSVKTIGPHRATRDLIRELTAGDRDYLLLRVRAATFGGALSMIPVCPGAGCGARMNLDLLVDDFPTVERPVEPVHEIRLGGPRPLDVVFRLPRGVEQEAIAAAPEVDADAQRDRLLASCIVRMTAADTGAEVTVGALTAPSKIALAAAIEEAAPGVDTDIELVCPECARTFDITVDPASLLLDEIGRGRGRLDREIHLLAFHYHWPLRELLALSRPRRQRYLQHLVAALESRSSRGLS